MCAYISRMEEFGRDGCIRGYHVFKEIWWEAIGEKLKCDREPENLCDHYTVAVKRSAMVIGHLPRQLSRVCLLFLRCGRVISSMETGLEIVQNRHGNYYSSSIDRTSTRTVSNVHVHVRV